MSNSERNPKRMNIHVSPEVMAGTYANFAQVTHTPYEFSLTFASVDFNEDAEEIPGVAVSRMMLSPRFLRELIDMLEDNWSKWSTKEGIRNLPETEPPDLGD